jgi:hypothetical protein
MANGKKSFILYCDLIHEVDHLTDEEKGRLFQHLLEYVNDMNPVMDDRVILGSWKHIQRQLKRDLEKYEGIKQKRVEAGRKGGKQTQAKQASASDAKAKQAVNDNGTVTVTVNDTDNEIKESVFDLFNRFWDLYDKKMDKVKCEIEWSNIDSAEYAKIIDHVPKFVKASGQYLCKPINYLTGRRWQDEELPNYSDNKQPKEQKLAPYTPKPPVH